MGQSPLIPHGKKRSCTISAAQPSGARSEVAYTARSIGTVCGIVAAFGGTSQWGRRRVQHIQHLILGAAEMLQVGCWHVVLGCVFRA